MRHFLAHFCKIHSKDIDDVDRDALAALTPARPGTSAYLRNAVESMVVRARGTCVPTRDDLPPEIWVPPVQEHGDWGAPSPA